MVEIPIGTSIAQNIVTDSQISHPSNEGLSAAEPRRSRDSSRSKVKEPVQTIGSEIASGGLEGACRHHWIIEPPTGSISDGTCKNCGRTREFKNTIVSEEKWNNYSWGRKHSELADENQQRPAEYDYPPDGEISN